MSVRMGPLPLLLTLSPACGTYLDFWGDCEQAGGVPSTGATSSSETPGVWFAYWDDEPPLHASAQGERVDFDGQGVEATLARLDPQLWLSSSLLMDVVVERESGPVLGQQFVGAGVPASFIFGEVPEGYTLWDATEATPDTTSTRTSLQVLLVALEDDALRGRTLLAWGSDDDEDYALRREKCIVAGVRTSL